MPCNTEFKTLPPETRRISKKKYPAKLTTIAWRTAWPPDRGRYDEKREPDRAAPDAAVLCLPLRHGSPDATERSKELDVLVHPRRSRPTTEGQGNVVVLQRFECGPAHRQERLGGGAPLPLFLDPLRPERIDHVAIAAGCLVATFAAIIYTVISALPYLR